MHVLKFGGDAMGHRDSLGRVADRIEAARPCVAVCSAAAGVTDRLDELADAKLGARALEEAIDRLRDRHRALYDGDRSRQKPDLGQRLDDQLDRLHSRLASAARDGADPWRRAEILATGERLAATVLDARLRARGIDAHVVPPEQAGLRTTGDPRRASVQLPPTRAKVREALTPLLETGPVPIVPGFHGYDEAGRVNLLGRDGSDVTAAIVAHSLDAEQAILVKDVGAIHTADPRGCPEAQPVAEASYAQVEVAARHGARVVHPAAIEPLQARGIPLRIQGLEAEAGDGTLVHTDPDPKETDVVLAHDGDEAASTITVVPPSGQATTRQTEADLRQLHRALLEGPTTSENPPEARTPAPSSGRSE